MNDKPEGWFYVGDGKLRYRDDYGWTDFYMDTTDPRARDWPPASPVTLLQQCHEEEGVRPGARSPRGFVSILLRGRSGTVK